MSLTLAQIRRMTDAELDANLICRRCWETYSRCGCKERKVRAGGVAWSRISDPVIELHAEGR